MAINTIKATILGQAQGVVEYGQTVSVGSYSMDSTVDIFTNSQTEVCTNCVIKFQLPEFTGVSLSVSGYVTLTYENDIHTKRTFDYILTTSPLDKAATIVSGTVTQEIGNYSPSFNIDITSLRGGETYYLILTGDENNGAALEPACDHWIKLSYMDGGLVYIDNGSTLEAYSVYIDNGSSWDLYIPYIDNGSSWDICI